MTLPAVNSIVERNCGQLAAAQSHLEQAIAHLQQAGEAMRVAGGEHAQYVLQPLYRKFQYGMPTGQALLEVKDQLAKKMTEAAWLHIISHIKLDHLMTERQHLDFKAEIGQNPPPFTPDAVAEIFFNLAENRKKVAVDGLTQTFRALNFKFKSQSAFCFGRRVILSGVAKVDWCDRLFIDTVAEGIRRLRDLQRGVNMVLYPDRRFNPEADIVAMLVNHVALHQSEILEHEYLSVKVCKNGNAHVWFSDPQVADRLNEVLAEHYGAAIAEC